MYNDHHKSVLQHFHPNPPAHPHTHQPVSFGKCKFFEVCESVSLLQRRSFCPFLNIINILFPKFSTFNFNIFLFLYILYFKNLNQLQFILMQGVKNWLYFNCFSRLIFYRCMVIFPHCFDIPTLCFNTRHMFGASSGLCHLPCISLFIC